MTTRPPGCASSGDGTVRIWDPETSEKIHVLPGGESHTAAFSPVRQQVISGSRDGGARLWSIAARAEFLITFQHPGAVLTAAWSPDGDEMLTGCEDGVVRVWPVSPERIIEELRHRVHLLFPDDEIRQRFPDWPAAD